MWGKLTTLLLGATGATSSWELGGVGVGVVIGGLEEAAEVASLRCSFFARRQALSASALADLGGVEGVGEGVGGGWIWAGGSR